MEFDSSHQPAQDVKILTPAEMRLERSKSCLYVRKHMNRQQMHRMMRTNGSVPSPNPWYIGPKKKDSSSTTVNSNQELRISNA